MKFLVDTDVLIDYFRGINKAVNFIKKNHEQIVLSTITVAELYAGVREGEERENLDEFIKMFDSIPMDIEIAKRGGLFKRDYRPSCNIGWADAMIAATADIMSLKLVTLNTRHFPMFNDIKPPYTKNS